MKRPRQAVDDRSQVERVYTEIHDRILDGRYRPGAPLAEVTLATTHGTSRTPVREVLSRLHQEGWVERVERRGFFVARIAMRALKDTFEVRRVLEGAAAAGAARHAEPIEVQRLQRLVDEDASAEHASFRKAEAANKEFHLAIAAASHNQFAAGLIGHCLAQMDRVLALGVNAQPLQQGTHHEHRAIVDAIARQDAAAAQRAMEEHLDRCAALLREALFSGAVHDIGA
jgi:DNA-binding GntR family transcriptional regulator